MFAFWVLYLWAKRGERVVLAKEDFYLGEPLLLTPDGAFVLGKHELMAELSNPGTKYVEHVPCICTDFRARSHAPIRLPYYL